MMIDKRKFVCCDYVVFSSGSLPGGPEKERMRNKPSTNADAEEEIMRNEPKLPVGSHFFETLVATTHLSL